MLMALNFSVFGIIPPSKSESEEIGSGCVSNISPAERRRRLLSGMIGLAIALAVLAVLLVSGADRLWRLPLFLLFWGAGIGYFQWQDRT